MSAHDNNAKETNEAGMENIVWNQQVIDILENMTEAFCAFDKEWRYIYVNGRLEALVGKKREELLGKIHWEVYPEAIGTIFDKKLHEAMDNQVSVELEAVYPANQRWYRLHIVPSPFGLSVYSQDITGQKELERQRDEFIGIASHELRTPITAIKGYTQLLQRTFEKQGLQHYATMLTHMDGQLSRLSKLVTDLLDISKMHLGKISYMKEAFDFNAWLNDLLTDLRQASPHHAILVNGTAGSKVFGDRSRLEQVFINLITNAIKFSPNAEHVDIEITSLSTHAKISVRDYGIGISEEHQGRIFDRFYRVSSLSDNTFPGLGVGLYISREIVQEHEGNIWVESAPTQGSTFHVTLPLAA